MPFYQIERFNPSSSTKGNFYDFVFDGVLYNNDNLPNSIYIDNHFNNLSPSSPYRSITPISLAIPILTGRYTGSYTGYPLTAYFPNIPTGVSGNNLGEGYISGKYRLRTDIAYPIKMCNATVNVKYALNGINYIAMVFPYNDNSDVAFNFSANLANVIYNADTYNVGGYTTYPEFDVNLTLVHSPPIELFNLSLGNYTLKDSYKNSIIDFGDVPQLVPALFVTWINSIADKIYENSITIKSYTGDIILAEKQEIAPITEVSLTIIGKQKTLSLSGDGKSYSLQWDSETPEGKLFLGLSTSPKSNRPTLTANISTQVSWIGDLVFYESYGTYRPPATTFDINLYQNSAEVNRVDKGNYLVSVGTLSGALRDECSMLTPSIVYQSSDVPNFNYVYIPIFNRYYFVTSLSSVSKNVWRMELNCDVLMTYKNEILLLQGVVGRQEFDFNPMLVDSEIPTQDNPEVEIINIPSTAFLSHTNITGNLYNFVLTVIG